MGEEREEGGGEEKGGLAYVTHDVVGEEREEGGGEEKGGVAYVTHDVCFQGKVLEEGVQLHSQVCPETMRALHNRMEDLLEDYLSNYGNQNSIGSQDYDPSAASPVVQDPASPEKRHLSSSRRKTTGQMSATRKLCYACR